VLLPLLLLLPLVPPPLLLLLLLPLSGPKIGATAAAVAAAATDGSTILNKLVWIMLLCLLHAPGNLQHQPPPKPPQHIQVTLHQNSPTPLNHDQH